MDFCQDCGTPYTPDSKFCSYCGQRILVHQYQAEQDRRLLANQSAARKLAMAALILLGCGILLDLGGTLYLYARHMAIQHFLNNLSSFLFPNIIIAILPIFTGHCTTSGKVRSANLIKNCALLFLSLQTIGSILIYIWETGSTYEIVSAIFKYVNGAYLFWDIRGFCRTLYYDSLMFVFSNLCFWGVNILCILAASKLKKSGTQA